MLRIFVILGLLFLLTIPAVHCYAQIQIGILRASAPVNFDQIHAQQPEAPQTNDYSPSKWDEYSSPLGQYRIRFPKPPRDISKTEGRYESRGMEYHGVLIYRVVYVDYEVPIENPSKVKDVLNGVKESALNAVRDRGLLVLTEKEVEIDGHSGIYVHLELQRKDVIRMEWVIAGSKLYTISTLTRKGTSSDAAAKNDYEEISAAFFSSFHIIP